MKNSKQLIRYLGTMAIVFFMYGCTYDENECSIADVSYATNIHPMLDSNCSVCHFGENPSAGLDLSDYEQVSDTIISGKILERTQLELSDDDIMPPSENPPLSDCQIQLFKNWVDQGALNN